MYVGDPTDLALADTLRRLRRASGCTQEDLAHDAGITVTGLARIERGKSNPGWMTVRRIACALDVSLADLIAAVEDASV
jgi:transcriptional regulator with XRE-family HTH domain